MPNNKGQNSPPESLAEFSTGEVFTLPTEAESSTNLNVFVGDGSRERTTLRPVGECVLNGLWRAVVTDPLFYRDRSFRRLMLLGL